MSHPLHSRKGDLTNLAKDIEKAIQKHLPRKERPAFAIAFTLPEDYSEAHYVTNTSEENAALILDFTCQKIRSKLN